MTDQDRANAPAHNHSRRDRGALNYDEVASLRRLNPAWKLLRTDNAPLILSFLGTVFIDENVRDISATDLLNRLDDELYALNQRLGEGTFKSAKAYLDDWSTSGTPWLRKYYINGSDEPHYDATQAVERAVAWVSALREREFVGTESRLNTVFELLRQIVYGSDTDPQVRLAELKRRRAEIDNRIAATERGDYDVMDSLGRRDRYQQFAETSRALLSDFREVEANLRGLDRQMREKIATWQGTKGELLDEFVGTRSGIGNSDQGRSLQAFYNLLLSSDRLAELTELIAGAERLDDSGVIDERLSRIHYDWLTAAKRAQDIVGQLSQQLRRFLDDHVWLENRRVMDLLHGIESSAVALRDDRAEDFPSSIDAAAPAISLPTERPLYRKPVAAQINSTGIEYGQVKDIGDALYEQKQLDTAPLIANVRTRLRRTGQATLADVLSTRPLDRGLEELVAYLHLSEGDFDTVVDDSRTDTVSWTGPDGKQRTARMARVIYVHTGSGAHDDSGDLP